MQCVIIIGLSNITIYIDEKQHIRPQLVNANLCPLLPNIERTKAAANVVEKKIKRSKSKTEGGGSEGNRK